MLMDLKWEKVCNWWIGIGFCTGLIWQWGHPLKYLAGVLVPLGILFVLFLYKMLGTGDIKVFMVLGGILGVENVIWCMILSFVLGAVYSVFLLIFRCDWKDRMLYFVSYVQQVFGEKKYQPYLIPGNRPENIHFTTAIFLSIMILILKGGMQ